MPTYQYKCENCNHELEIHQSFNDEHLKKCPECKKNKLQRLIGGGLGFFFKGGSSTFNDGVPQSLQDSVKIDRRIDQMKK